MGTVLLAGPQSDGRCAVIETHGRRGAAEPCHIHAREDELIYVVAGAVLVQIGEAVRRHGPGACIFLPHGREHAIQAASATARWLTIASPAGIEGYYREGAAAEGGADAVERQIAVAARHGVTITGPAPQP